MAETIKHIFVTHIHKDDDGVFELKDLLKTKGMTVRNYSIASDKSNNAKSEDYIKSKILAPRIQRCSVLAVYVTTKTKDSYWTNWELNMLVKRINEL